MTEPENREREERLDRADLQDRKDHRDRQDRRDRWAMKERFSYVTLAVIIMMLFVIFGVGGVVYINNNNRAWCEIIHISTPVTPPPKPFIGQNDPNAARRYNGYEALQRLDRRFGCN